MLPDRNEEIFCRKEVFKTSEMGMYIPFLPKANNPDTHNPYAFPID